DRSRTRRALEKEKKVVKTHLIADGFSLKFDRPTIASIVDGKQYPTSPATASNEPKFTPIR
ncbi:hypothetical protein ACLOJK_034536, partial [Asimina triloba]